MKRISSNKLVSNILLVLGTCVGGFAQADATYTYQYNYTWSVGGGTGSQYINSTYGTWYTGYNFNPSAATVTVTSTPGAPQPAPNTPVQATPSLSATAWANTQGDNGPTSATSDPTQYSQQTIEQGLLKAWSGGLGVLNDDYVAHDSETKIDTSEGLSSTPYEHSTDNNGRWDSILYSFGQGVTLTGVNLTWANSDSDITVLAYTGSDANNVGFDINSKLNTFKYDQLIGNGWSLISNITDQDSYSKTFSTNTTSSYWLVGAMNTTFGNNDSSKDYVKIGALSGYVKQTTTVHDNNGVPEPGSLALLGLGGLLLLRARAKKS